MAEELKVGDVVCLKSNPEQKMTIETISGNISNCIFFNKEGIFKRQELYLTTISKYEEPSLRVRSI